MDKAELAGCVSGILLGSVAIWYIDGIGAAVFCGGLAVGLAIYVHRRMG